jgi:hypothetical protein
MNQLTVYMASKIVHAPKWRALRDAGYRIISTWIDEAGPGESKDLADLWSRCIREASTADLLVAYREPGEVLKGAFIEIGAALARGRLVHLVGFDDGTLSFVNHPGCALYGSVEEALGVATHG